MVSAPKLAATLAIIIVHSASAFTPTNGPNFNLRIPTSQLDLFGKAFANEDMGKKENPGLKKVREQ